MSKHQNSFTIRSPGAGENPAKGQLSTTSGSEVEWNQQWYPGNAPSKPVTGHFYTGPVNVPVQVTCMVSSTGNVQACKLALNEVKMYQLGEAAPQQVTELTATFAKPGLQTIAPFTATVVPKTSPSFWYYYAKTGAPAGSTTSEFIHSVSLREL